MGGWEPEPSGGSSRRRHRGAGGRNDHPPSARLNPPGGAADHRAERRTRGAGQGQGPEAGGEGAPQPDNRAEPRTHALPPGDLKQRRPKGRRHHSGLPSTKRNRRAGNKAPAKYGAAGASRRIQAPKAKEAARLGSTERGFSAPSSAKAVCAYAPAQTDRNLLHCRGLPGGCAVGRSYSGCGAAPAARHAETRRNTRRGPTARPDGLVRLSGG